MKSEQVILTSEFQYFIASCRSYCELLECNGEVDPTVFLGAIQKLLLEMYSKAVNHRTINIEFDAEFEVEIGKDRLEGIMKRTSERIGENLCYWAVFDPTENVFGNEAPVMGDLLDDIIDIYKDVKRQLLIFDIKTIESRESAVWGLNFLFWNHWGAHAIDAMRTIHYVLEKTEKYK
jgi:hypothetical protein